MDDINYLLSNNYDYCKACKKYYKKDPNNIIEEQETRYECTFCDNRESTHENRHYIVTYNTCPLCKNRVELKKERCILKTVFVRKSDIE